MVAPRQRHATHRQADGQGELRASGEQELRAVRVTIWVTFVFALVDCLIFAPTANAESIRLRLAWGGGEKVTWQGRINVSEGNFSAARCLSSETDAATSIFVESTAIQIMAPRQLAYQALDVTLKAPLNATLEISFAGETIRDAARTLSVPVADLLAEPVNQPLDAAGNRLLIRRAPGDEIRINSARDQLVFSPGDRWEINVQPNLIRPPAADGRLAIQMLPARSNQVVWRTEVDLANENGTQSARTSIPIPKTEGVYDLVVSYARPRNRGLFRNNSHLAERRVQFIVVSSATVDDPARSSGGVADWREVISFDATQPQWWQRLGITNSNWQRLSIAPRRLQGKGTADAIEYEGQRISRLAPEGWQTYPLPIVEVGQPHILEVEYPAGAPQSLGVSVVESGADGPDNLQSLDHAIHVQSPSWMLGTNSCRVIFWPRTRMPHVLLTNLDEQRDAVFGRIRLLQGPSNLPAAESRGSDHGYRSAMAQFDAPDFFKAFSASYGVDEDSGRGLTDWVTFAQSGRRMVEYLQHAGFGGATVTCISDGGAICPVRQMNGTPRFDSGPFFETGQDIYQKDVLEYLLRLFDREQLRFMVGVKLNASLPELEQQLRDPQRSEGLVLVDATGNPIASAETKSPRYNPLDPRVQQATIRLVRDLVVRYSRHPSFAGVSLEVGPDTFLNLPSADCGYDRQTLAAFQRDHAQEIAKTNEEFSVAQIINGPLRPVWLDWRSERVSQTYAAIARELKSARPDARLVLSTGKAVQTELLQSVCRPGLPRITSVASGLFAMGINGERLAKAGVVVAKPDVHVPLDGLAEHGASREYSMDASWQLLAGNGPLRESHLYQRPFPFRSVGFEVGQVFSGEVTEAPLKFHVSRHGGVRLRDLSRSLAEGDSQSITLGGDHVGLIESAELRQWLSIYRQLPARPFVSSSSNINQAGQHPLVVRQLSYAGKTYIYAINNSPWPTQMSVSIQSKGEFSALGRTDTDENQTATFSKVAGGDRYLWKQELAAFELAAYLVTDPDAVVDQIEAQLPTSVNAELQRAIADVSTRLSALKQAVVYDKLSNPGFDVDSITVLPNWESSSDPNVTIQRDSTVQYSGSASLKIESRQPIAWVRSTPIPVPRSGRLAVQAMVRSQPTRQTRASQPLRLAIEGVLDGSPYYRFAEVNMAAQPNRPATANRQPLVTNSEWSPFMLQVDDLPAGLTELRVRFDLMGAGAAWIDDIRLFDLAISDDEQVQLAKIIGLADFHLREGRPADCERILRSYWPQYLLDVVPLAEPRLANLPDTTPPAASPARTIPRIPVPDAGDLLNKVRELVPEFK